MKKIFALLFLLSFTLILYSQTTSCDELLQFITENSYKKATLNNYTLNSSWLTQVTAYTYEYKTYVVAEIKQKNAYTTNTYIFCGIPNQNWTNFQYGSYWDSGSYGERFHKYIIDYKCNCN